MKRRVLAVTDTKQQDLAVELMNAADGAFKLVRRNWDRVCGDPRGLKAMRSAGKGMITSPHIRQAPEDIRDNANIWIRRCRGRIKRAVIVARE